MSHLHGWRTLGCALGAVAALACGDSEVVEAAPERIGWSAPAAQEERAPGQNAAPRLQAVTLSPREPASGDRVRASVQANDPDGDRVEIAFVWSIGGDVQPASGQDLVLGELFPGELISVEVTASDGNAASAPVVASVRVRNRRPVITRVTLKPGGSVSRGLPLSAMAEARDPDRSPITFRYTWLVNGRTTAEGATLDTSSLRVGDTIQVSVIASDGTDESDPIESAPVRVANGLPEILSMPSAALEDGEFRYVIEARDPDGDRNLRYYLTQAPKGMTINSLKGVVRWRPSPEQAGKHAVEVAVEDSGGERVAQTFELTVATDSDQLPAAGAP